MENELVNNQPIVSMATDALVGMIPENERLELEKQIQAEASKNLPPQTQAPQPEQPQAPEVKVEETDKELESSIFFSDLNKPKETPIEFKEFNEAATFIKEKTGIEVTNLNDLSKITEQFVELKSTTEKLKGFEEKATAWEKIYTELPDELYGAINAYYKGEDYRKLLQEAYKETLDFSIPVEKHDKQALVNSFFPGKFSTEDYEEGSDKEAAVEAYYELIKEKLYEEAKKNVVSKRTNYREKYNSEMEATTKLVKSSAENTLNSFVQSNKNINDNQKQSLSSILNAGQQGIINYFFDEKGAFKPDAAEKLFYAEHTKSEIDKAKKIFEKRMLNQKIEEIVPRMNDKPNGGKGGNISIEDQQKAAELRAKQLMS